VSRKADRQSDAWRQAAANEKISNLSRLLDHPARPTFTPRFDTARATDPPAAGAPTPTARRDAALPRRRARTWV